MIARLLFGSVSILADAVSPLLSDMHHNVLTSYSAYQRLLMSLASGGESPNHDDLSAWHVDLEDASCRFA